MREVPVGKSHVALVDDEDYERVIGLRWSYANGYAMNGKHGSMHIFIMKPPKGFVVHHRHRNKLDNRRSELEIVTHAEHGRRHSGPNARNKRDPNEPGKASKSIRLEPALWERLGQHARHNKRTINAQVEMAVEWHLGNPEAAARRRPGPGEE